ncbi:MAG: hypothetical protein C4334_01805 [Pyrinomonas sp.]
MATSFTSEHGVGRAGVTAQQIRLLELSCAECAPLALRMVREASTVLYDFEAMSDHRDYASLQVISEIKLSMRRSRFIGKLSLPCNTSWTRK